MASNGVLITLRGGPHNGLQVPGAMADRQTGDVSFATMLYRGAPPSPVIVTYRRSAPDTATFARIDAPQPADKGQTRA